MATKYEYSVTNDFPNQVVNLDTLSDEVDAAGLASEISHINLEDGDCIFVFPSPISTEDEGKLDVVVAAHVGTPTVSEAEPIIITDTPDADSKFWLNPADSMVYILDSTRSCWLSTHRSLFSFARRSQADGMYLPLLGDLDNVDDVYMPGRQAVIVSAFCRSVSGDDTKEFEVRKNGEAIFTFSYPGSGQLMYQNNNLNLELGQFDKIQVYVTKAGDKVHNTLCRLEIAWRYNA